MAAGATYEPIATTTLSSAQTSVTFSSISGSYTDLVLIANSKVTGSPGRVTTVQFNSDTGSNYSYTFMGGNGSTVSSGRSNNDDRIRIQGITGINADNFYPVVMSIQNYSNTTTHKTSLIKTSEATGVQFLCGLWKSTSAINEIRIVAYGNTEENWASGCTFTLYGIAAA
jgi:hypothetical protein